MDIPKAQETCLSQPILLQTTRLALHEDVLGTATTIKILKTKMETIILKKVGILSYLIASFLPRD